MGRPLPEIQGGGATGGSAAVALAGAGDVSPAGEPSIAGAPDTGAAGAKLTQPSDPPWIANACTPTLKYSNHDTTAQGKLFDNAAPDPSDIIWPAAHDACRILFRNASEVKPVTEISLVVEDSSGIAFTVGNEIHLSTRYLRTLSDKGADLTLEITGIFHFTTSLIYQNPGSSTDTMPPTWLIVGMADYVRLESGYLDRSLRVKGDNYDTSSQATAFFLDYLALTNRDIVYSLNQRLSARSAVWNDDVFVTLMGSDLSTLWAEYQATL